VTVTAESLRLKTFVPGLQGIFPRHQTMERVKRIAGHVVCGGIAPEQCSAAIPVMEAMKTKIATLAGGGACHVCKFLELGSRRFEDHDRLLSFSKICGVELTYYSSFS